MPAIHSSHAGIIAALGIAALAREIGVSDKMVGGWKTRNSVPGGWYRSFVRAAAALGCPEITVDLLADLVDASARSSDVPRPCGETEEKAA